MREITAWWFAPIARGFLAADGLDPENLADKDIRRAMPRFQPEHWPANARLLPAWVDLAREAEVTPAQLALAWLLSRGEHVNAYWKLQSYSLDSSQEGCA